MFCYGTLLPEDRRMLEQQREKFNSVNYALLRQQDFVTKKHRRQPEEMYFALQTAAFAYASPELCYHPEFDDLTKPMAPEQGEEREEKGDEGDDARGFQEDRSFLDRMLRHVARGGASSLRSYLEPALAPCASDDDLVARAKHGHILHRFICFTLNFNDMFVYPERMGWRGESGEARWMYRVTCVERKRKRQEEQEQDSDKAVVFHGTGRHRLYSLMRNGARTLRTVSCGRAQGHGFYCTPDFSLARTYSDAFVCAYVLRDPARYAVRGGVYVVDDPDALTLAYVLPKDADRQVVECVKRRIGGEGSTPAQTPAAAEEGTSSATSPARRPLPNAPRRILAEIQRTLRMLPPEAQHEHGVGVEVDEADCKAWTVRFRSFDPDSQLSRDMTSLGVPHVALRVQLPPDFPNDPPFIRVLSPRFRRGTGHVTSGGALCAEFLTNSGTESAWSPTMAMGTVLVMVQELLSRNGRLLGATAAEEGQQEAYDENEARLSFDRLLKDHGWRK